jgi:hypothetical protein
MVRLSVSCRVGRPEKSLAKLSEVEFSPPATYQASLAPATTQHSSPLPSSLSAHFLDFSLLIVDSHISALLFVRPESLGRAKYLISSNKRILNNWPLDQLLISRTISIIRLFLASQELQFSLTSTIW